MILKNYLLPASLAFLMQSSLAFTSPAENLAEALTFETVSKQDRGAIEYQEFSKFHTFLRRSYPWVFSRLNVEVVNNYSLLIQWPGTEPELEGVLYTAHMDVVPIEPGTEDAWEHPPFAGVVADGKIYGRGSLDDKQGVIGLLEAAEALLAEGFKPRRSIVMAFGHDEEISGLDGAAKLAARMGELGLRFQWMVDEGGMVIGDNPLLPGRPLGLVNVAEKAYLTLTLVATGPGGHSSQPPHESTIGRLAAAVARVEQNPLPTRLVEPVSSMLATVAPYTDQPQRFVLGNLWLTGSLVANQMAGDALTSSFVRTTTALTMFNAGIKENVVPQRAEAKINFRLLPGDTPESVVKHVTEQVADESIVITFEPWAARPPVAQYPGGGFAVISEATQSVYPDAVMVPSLLAGATDIRHYLDRTDNHYRFHGVYMDADQARSIHGTNEFVSIASFENSIRIAMEMMRLGSR